MSDTVVLETSPVTGPQPGDVIAGKYRLERELGRGAMGTVWSAVHVTLAQRVAIKLIASEQAASPDARHRFSVEAKAAARLRSRHVVQVYDDGETPDGTPYIVMEYLEGQTLEQRLEENRDMTLGEAVRITSHVGRALARAHAQNVVHRDLKSGNIFIAKSEDDELGWVAKVLDFGVAKVLTESGPSTTKTGTIVGTPLFMSPEQIRGASHVDHRADLYSLGMVFYNMVTGSHAFDGPSYSDVLVAICTEVLPDIRVAAPWLPPGVRAWFDKACARERDERFQSADEMIDALQDAAGPGGRMSRPSTPDEMGGPSGTLLGYMPPHAAATIIAGDGSPGSRADPISATVALAPPDGNTLRSGQRAALEKTAPGRTRALPANLWLWAASGVGLAIATMALVLALGHEAPAPRASTPREEVVLPTTPPTPVQQPAPRAPATVATSEATIAAPVPSPAAAIAEGPTTTAPAAATPPATTSGVPSRDGASAAARRAPAPRRSGQVAVAAPPSPEPPSPARPRPAATEPDMGF